MIFRALGTDNDWTFGKGKENYLFNQDAVSINIKTRLLSFLNDCFFDMNAGVDWFFYFGTPNKSREIELRSRAVILQSYGVVSVTSVILSINRVTRAATLTYIINTIYTINYTENVKVTDHV